MMFSLLTTPSPSSPSTPSTPRMSSQRVESSSSSSGMRLNSMLKLILLSALAVQASAWGSSSSDSDYDVSMYGNSISRDWLYDSSGGMSIQLEGCVWGYVGDSEDSGCLEDSSEDGTESWYQMANCRRAQAVYSVYASTSSHASCNSGNFKETVSFFEMEKVNFAQICAPLLTLAFPLVILKYYHSLLQKMGLSNSFTISLTTMITAPFPMITMMTVAMMMATVIISKTSQCVHQQMGYIMVLAARMMAPFLFCTLTMSTVWFLPVVNTIT
jgi:hypothetical protein